MLGLGYLGINDTENALIFLKKAAEMDVNHQGVQSHIPMELINQTLAELHTDRKLTSKPRKKIGFITEE